MTSFSDTTTVYDFPKNSLTFVLTYILKILHSNLNETGNRSASLNTDLTNNVDVRYYLDAISKYMGILS